MLYSCMAGSPDDREMRYNPFFIDLVCSFDGTA